MLALPINFMPGILTHRDSNFSSMFLDSFTTFQFQPSGSDIREPDIWLETGTKKQQKHN